MTPGSPDRIRVVCTEPELADSAPTAYRPWIDERAHFIGQRIPFISPATATAITSGYQAATFAALVA